MSHTPGPWTFTTPKFGEDHTLITDMCTPLGKVSIKDTSKRAHDEALANAKLIAAAPDMLEALEACVDKLAMWPEGANPEFLPCMKAARAIVKQAKGEV